jgi:hypothetical protein
MLIASASGNITAVILSDTATAEPDIKIATIGVMSDVPHDGHPSPIIASKLIKELLPIVSESIFFWWRNMNVRTEILIP